MKIALTSDIHLEFGDWYPVNPENADVLILSGDIMVAFDLTHDYKSQRFIEFLKNTKKEYKEVIYIMGNHEHYQGDFSRTAQILRDACSPLGIHFLDTESVTIEDITFIGGTLWTDMNKEMPTTLNYIRKMMNDFRVIRNSNRMFNFKDETGKIYQRASTFSPEDAVEEHKKMLEYIHNIVKDKPDQKFVVVSHHAPSKLSAHPIYSNDEVINGAYSSQLDDFILAHPQIKLWTHGHTHNQFDYTIGSTRVVCNPRGYVNYERKSNEVDPYFPKVLYV